MPWQIALIIYLVASAALALQRRSYSQSANIPATIPSFIYGVLVISPGGLIAALIADDWAINWSVLLVAKLALMGAGIAMFSWFSLRAFEQLSVAVFQTIFQLFSVTIAIGGWIFLGEGLSNLQVIGGFLLVGGAILAAQSLDHSKTSTRSGIFFAVIGSICLGLAAVTEKSLLNDISLGAYFLVGWSAQVVATGVVAFKDVRKLGVTNIPKYDIIESCKIGVILLFVGFSFLYLLREVDNVSVIGLASAFILPVSALASYVILQEKELNWKLKLGLALGFVGLIITIV